MDEIKCQVMGIINITPDSFSDGGKFYLPDEAFRRANNLLEEGAAVLDLGAESTRPSATEISWEEEWQRLKDPLKKIATLKTKISVDTYHVETAARALDLGVQIINCVKSEPIKELDALISKYKNAELIMPFRADCDSSRVALKEITLPIERIYLDPMIGFNTTREEDIALLQSITEIKKYARVVIGGSRKRIVKKMTGEKVTGKNVGGNIALAIYASQKGASLVRVHDVRETVQAIKVLNALSS